MGLLVSRDENILITIEVVIAAAQDSSLDYDGGNG